MKHTVLLLASIGLALASLSCTSESQGLFYSLEIEQKAADNTLKNDLTINGIAAFGSEFYAAAGSVFYRQSGSTTWSKITNPNTSGMPGAVASSIVSDGTVLWVAFSNGSTHGVYSLNPTTHAYGSNIYSSKQVTRLWYVNSQLLAAAGTEIGGNAELLYYNGSTFAPTGLDNDAKSVYVGVAHDGTSWFVLSRTKVFQTATALSGATPWLSVTSVTATGGLSGKTGFRSIIANGTTIILCAYSGSSGYLITHSGGTWTSSTAHSRSFNSLIRAGSYNVVGTASNGIYYFTTDINSIASPGGNYTSIPDLPYVPVQSLFFSGTTLMIGSVSQGLWTGTFSDPSSSQWTQE